MGRRLAPAARSPPECVTQLTPRPAALGISLCSGWIDLAVFRLRKPRKMQPDLRWLLYAAATLLLISGCDLNSPWGSSGTGSDYGSNSAGGRRRKPAGPADRAEVKPGVGGESTINGADDSVSRDSLRRRASPSPPERARPSSITFTSSDGLAITGFEISGSLGNLPAGWSGPSIFACSLVSAGSGCVLNLTYAPTAVDSGSLVDQLRLHR